MENFDRAGDVSKLLKEKYGSKADESGFLYIGAFATGELKRQSKSVAGFLDGDEGTNPDINLGNGLRFTGISGNYSDMKIHIDDVDESVRRVRDYYGE
jgi:hypothetical protein